VKEETSTGRNDVGVHAYAITQTAAWGVVLHGKKKGLGSIGHVEIPDNRYIEPNQEWQDWAARKSGKSGQPLLGSGVTGNVQFCHIRK
jgi:hypothetical protein